MFNLQTRLSSISVLFLSPYLPVVLFTITSLTASTEARQHYASLKVQLFYLICLWLEEMAGKRLVPVRLRGQSISLQFRKLVAQPSFPAEWWPPILQHEADFFRMALTWDWPTCWHWSEQAFQLVSEGQFRRGWLETRLLVCLFVVVLRPSNI